MISCASLHIDSFGETVIELLSQYPYPSSKMHALAPIFNLSFQVNVMPDMNCDGDLVSGFMPISLQEGVCCSECPFE